MCEFYGLKRETVKEIRDLELEKLLKRDAKFLKFCRFTSKIEFLVDLRSRY